MSQRPISVAAVRICSGATANCSPANFTGNADERPEHAQSRPFVKRIPRSHSNALGCKYAYGCRVASQRPRSTTESGLAASTVTPVPTNLPPTIRATTRVMTFGAFFAGEAGTG